MKEKNLSYRIISSILIFTIVLGLLLFFVYYFFTHSTIEKTTQENAAFWAQKTVKQIEEVLKPSEIIPENLSWIIETGVIQKDSVFSFLTKLVRNNPAIYASAIAFEPYLFSDNEKFGAPYAFRNGEMVNTTVLGSEEYNYFIMDWYQIPAILQQAYWSEPYYDEGGAGALLSTYSVPFFLNKDGKRIFAGIITVDISLDWLTEIVNSVKILENGYAFLISKNGMYVTHPNRTFIMNETIFTRAKELNLPEMRLIGRSMIAGESGLSSLKLPDTGKVWIYYTQLPSTKWSLGVVYPHNEMFAGLRKLNLILLLLAVTGLSVLVFFTIKIISNLTSPLTIFAKSARSIAEGNFNSELPGNYKTKEMNELHDSFEFMQKELSAYIVNLKETTTAKEKIESELRIAKEIQMGMIPHIFPPFPDLPEIDLFASLESAKEVGGDLYDFFLIDKNKLCFAIGDVSGKGIPASLFMAVTRTLLRSVADKSKNIADIVSSMNKTLTLNNESNMFVTFFAGILDIEKGELKYCNAGHNPPVLIKKDKTIQYFNITKSIPVGLFDSYEYQEEAMKFEKGDQIFLYTDGLTEAEDKDNNLFGDDHLLQTIQNNYGCTPKQLIKNVTIEVRNHVKEHIQSDDLTMLCITYIGEHETR